MSACVLVLSSAIPLVGPVAAAPAPPWDPFFATPTVVASLAPIVPSGSSNRTYGVAAGDFDGDLDADLVVGRADGRVFLLRGNGDGTFAAPVLQAWKLEGFNAWALAAGDVNGDGKLDLLFGANVSGADAGAVVRVNDGDVRYIAGIGDGTFSTAGIYLRSGVTFNAGTLIADIGTDAGSVAVANIDGDGDLDLVAGAVEGVRILRNNGGAFAVEPLATGGTYFPATSTQNSPWGLAFGDADADGDADLFVGDRALYVYLYRNDGGAWTLVPGNIAALGSTRANVYVRHDTIRAAVGFTGAMTAGDVTGDGRADLALGLHSGLNTPTTGCGSPTGPCPNDGTILLDVSDGASPLRGFGALSDIGTAARGVTFVDLNGDGALDIVSGNYEGQVVVQRQLAPIDSDGDGVSDYVDNAPDDPNAARIDMNTDGALNHRDQLDNDFDTVLGNPEDQSTWQRLGDAADGDDDNDGALDATDNCTFVPNMAQTDVDGDGLGDACDPLDDRDTDADGVPDGPLPGDPLYAHALAAAKKWSTGDTHFVIRIDALGRLFQNEFTGLMTDAAISSAEEWAAKCQGMYTPGTDPDPGCANLAGGVGVPVSLVVIPRLLWTDPEVINWINDRNDNPRFDLGQHGTYHNSGPSNTQLGDWKDDASRNFFSCDTCGLTPAENYELLKVGRDTLTGDYTNKWLVDSGATASSPKIDWSTSANPLISYAPPFNASDEEGRKAVALLGYKAWSASVHEEGGGSLGQFFSPDENAFEQFDRFGLFHASADLEFEPPVTTNGSYDPAAYQDYLVENTQPGGLNTWLIEEVEWSGRPCNDLDRLADLCNGASNRENNTVYGPRWAGWIQLLEYVRDYPGGVAMTLGEVALAKAFDNAPTVDNADQADTDSDGIGDVIDGAAMTAADASLGRNVEGSLSATLTNGAGDPIAGQEVSFAFDADGDATDETYTATTDAAGLASVSVTATRPIGPATFSVSWDGLRATATDSADVAVTDASYTTLDADNPATGQVTDTVIVGATLTDSDSGPIAGRTIDFAIGTATGSGITDATGHASASLTLVAPAGSATLSATFEADADYATSTTSAPFTVAKEDTALVLADAVATRNGRAIAAATLKEADGAALSGQTITFQAQEKIRNQLVWTTIGTAVTDASGVARLEVPTKYAQKAKTPIRATFAGDASFLGSTGNAFSYRK